jgi:hypothetical protein
MSPTRPSVVSDSGPHASFILLLAAGVFSGTLGGGYMATWLPVPDDRRHARAWCGDADKALFAIANRKPAVSPDGFSWTVRAATATEPQPPPQDHSHRHCSAPTHPLWTCQPPPLALAAADHSSCSDHSHDVPCCADAGGSAHSLTRRVSVLIRPLLPTLACVRQTADRMGPLRLPLHVPCRRVRQWFHGAPAASQIGRDRLAERARARRFTADRPRVLRAACGGRRRLLCGDLQHARASVPRALPWVPHGFQPDWYARGPLRGRVHAAC